MLTIYFVNQDNYRIFATTCLPRFPSDQRAQGKPFIFYAYGESPLSQASHIVC